MRKAVDASPDAIFIVVTNPLDTMVYLAHKAVGLPRERLFGQAGMLGDHDAVPASARHSRSRSAQAVGPRSVVRSIDPEWAGCGR